MFSVVSYLVVALLLYGIRAIWEHEFYEFRERRKRITSHQNETLVSTGMRGSCARMQSNNQLASMKL